jgi:hypothetical protein
MRLLLATVAILLSTPSLAAEDSQQQVVAKRFVSALQTGAQITESDFVKPPSDDDLRALSVIAGCQVRTISLLISSTVERPDVFRTVPDMVSALFDCEGVPNDTPAGLTFEFDGERIRRIETHSFDLIGRH